MLDVGNAADDKPPTVAWVTPKAGAKLGNTTTLTVTAADDRGVALVRFLDDDRVVCEDTAAPYTCAYAPRGEDVGPQHADRGRRSTAPGRPRARSAP